MNCPLCQAEMIEANFPKFKYWECKKEVYINNKNIVHYRNTVYHNGNKYCKYIYPPFLIESLNDLSRLVLLETSETTSKESYYETNKVIMKPESFSLDNINYQNIFNKLKIYNIFS